MEKTLADKLMELKKLHEAGILTKEELETEKQKILNSGMPTENTQQEASSQDTSSAAPSPSSHAPKNNNTGLWIGIGVALLVAVVCIIAFSGNKKKNAYVYDDSAYEDSTYVDYDYEDYADENAYSYSNEIIEDEIDDIDEWAGSYVISGCAYRLFDSQAILTLTVIEKRKYYDGIMKLMLGLDDGNGQFDGFDGIMQANVKAKLQGEQMVVIMDNYVIQEIGNYGEWFESLQSGHQIFRITNSYGEYSVDALGEMETFFGNYACENKITKVYPL